MQNRKNKTNKITAFFDSIGIYDAKAKVLFFLNIFLIFFIAIVFSFLLSLIFDDDKAIAEVSTRHNEQKNEVELGGNLDVSNKKQPLLIIDASFDSIKYAQILAENKRMSRARMIASLQSAGFAKKESGHAVDALGLDFNNRALKSALYFLEKNNTYINQLTLKSKLTQDYFFEEHEADFALQSIDYKEYFNIKGDDINEN